MRYLYQILVILCSGLRALQIEFEAFTGAHGGRVEVVGYTLDEVGCRRGEGLCEWLQHRGAMLACALAAALPEYVPMEVAVPAAAHLRELRVLHSQPVRLLLWRRLAMHNILIGALDEHVVDLVDHRHLVVKVNQIVYCLLATYAKIVRHRQLLHVLLMLNNELTLLRHQPLRRRELTKRR